MALEKSLLDIVHAIDPTINIAKATENEDAAESFRYEENYDAFASRAISGVEFPIAQEKRDGLINELQGKLGSSHIVYFSEQNFGHQPDEITVLTSPEKYDALYFEGTNGINYDITVEDIVENLKNLETGHPFVLTGVGFDFVQGVFLQPLTDVEQLAEEMYEFCPDIVEQGTGTVAALAEELKRSNSFYYWWD